MSRQYINCKQFKQYSTKFIVSYFKYMPYDKKRQIVFQIVNAHKPENKIKMPESITYFRVYRVICQTQKETIFDSISEQIDCSMLLITSTQKECTDGFCIFNIVIISKTVIL